MTLGLVIFGVAIILVIISFAPSKSKRFRELNKDLYVIGMIRKLAKEDSIDLVEEYAELIKFKKAARARTQNLDDTIEENLQDKINDSFDKAQSKSKSKKEV